MAESGSQNRPQFRLLMAAMLFCCALAAIGFLRLDVETDVIRALPSANKVISDGLEIFAHHPLLEQVAIDVQLDRDDPDILVACGRQVEEELTRSGLFSRVGIGEIGAQFPALVNHVVRNLPLLFSSRDLEELVAPRLTPEALTGRLQELYADLSVLEGIGQAAFIGRDPLGLKDLVLARMGQLAPTQASRMYQGMLVSEDGRHLLVTARPAGNGTDTGFGRRIDGLLREMQQQLARRYAAQGIRVTLTPVGAYRAALDNETIIRRDVGWAIALAMAGISLLLLISFPRPFIGLLSLVPALAGTGVALFVYSLIHPSISIMVLGFGGAVVSITVDHGIAYLLFLDRPHATRGREAATEVRAIGLLAVCTTVGAFLVLSFSGFPLFVELGQFTALGVLFSFLFVHLVFPRVFPALEGGSGRSLPLQKLVDRCYGTGRVGAVAAAAFGLFMLFFAAPAFDVGLESMNTLSRETKAADRLFAEVWGGEGNSVFLMSSGREARDITKSDGALLAELERDQEQGVIGRAFVSSMVFPQGEAAENNFRAWQRFWTDERLASLQQELERAAAPLGFSSRAFAPFFSLFSPDLQGRAEGIDPRFYPLLGISLMRDAGGLVRFVTVEPGPQYDPALFYEKYSAFGKVYDGGYFADQLGGLLFATFSRMLWIIVVSISLLLLLFFLNLPLTLITLTPLLFAYVVTLATLKLMGRPLDIPSLMLSIVILGMGVDYAIFLVRAHQRYRDPDHPSYRLVRMAVFMAGASTLIGFGVLAGADHTLLQSIGITCLLGIGYALSGSFLLLPPLLGWYFSDNRQCTSADIGTRVNHRFRLLEPYPKMFARCKLKIDPLFAELPGLLPGPEEKRVANILDIGCGYGVPAAWCLEYYPQVRLTGLEPDPERVRVASLITGDRGRVVQGWAPELPQMDAPADLILILDMLHYLDDAELQALLDNCAAVARPGATLTVRYTVVRPGRPSLLWHLEQVRIRMGSMSSTFRTPEEVARMVEKAGFSVAQNRVSTDNQELCWLTARL